jgi:glycosyltransferase involved in cell wall biosynthesis
MHILFISQYFFPEIGAASERISGFARNLSRLGYKATVITGFPNYPAVKEYQGYRKKLFRIEKWHGVKVIRVWLFTTRRIHAAARLVNYLSFMLSSIIAGLPVKDVDYIFATSGPLFAGLAGYMLAAVKKAPLVFDVRDIWPERIYAGTDMKRGYAIRILEKLEMFLYKKAVKIIAVTNGVRANIVSKGIDPEKISVITNGVDTGLFTPRSGNRALAGRLGIEKDTFVVIYAGTLGLLQDLDLFVKCAGRLRNYRDILFLIIGGGAKRDAFIDEIKKNEHHNIMVIPPVDQKQLCEYINLSDVGINANTNSPHNLEEILEKNDIGECVSPGDVEAFSKAILKFYHNRELCRQCGENGYRLVNEHFSIDTLSRRLDKIIIQ